MTPLAREVSTRLATLIARIARPLIATILFASAFSVAWGKPDGGALIVVAGIWSLLFAVKR